MDHNPNNSATGDTDKNGKVSFLCDNFKLDIMERYFQGRLSDHEAATIESHCLICDVCKSIMAKAAAIWQESEKIAGEIPDDSIIGNMHQVIADHICRQSSLHQWAASDKTAGTVGHSFGVAVAVGEPLGAVITCSSWVGECQQPEGKFEIWGQQIKSLPDGVEIEEPLNYLEKKLAKGLFRVCPVLKAYNLDLRIINVDIQERIIARANSLSLAIVMAILNALNQRREEPPVIYSAGLAPDGRLEAVGHISLKIESGIAAGMTRYVFPKENSADIPESIIQNPDIQIKLFDTLQEVMLWSGVLRPARLSIELRPETAIASHPQTVAQSFEEAAWLDTEPPADINAVINKLSPNGENKRDLTRILEFLEDLCQTGAFQDKLSATFLYGRNEQVRSLLPPSALSFVDKCSLFDIADRLEDIAGILDGNRQGFVISIGGGIEAIRRVDIELTGRDDVSPLLNGNRHRYAMLTLLTGAIVLVIPPAGNRLHAYASGNLLAKYQNGRWSTLDYTVAAEIMSGVARDANLPWDAVKKVFKTAICMAEWELSGTFAFINDTAATSENSESRLQVRFGLRLLPASVLELSELDIIDMAKNEGAVLIDSKGIITQCLVFFKTRPQWTGGLSERHQHAQNFSRMTGALVIVASRDGTVTGYIKGSACICL